MFSSIITHRGIDIPLAQLVDISSSESSWESFYNQVEAGFGLEFDIQLMKDGGFAISHDTHLGRISKNEKRYVASHSHLPPIIFLNLLETLLISF